MSARELDLINTHTDERLKIVYWANGGYEPEALAEIDRLMRDHRSGVHAIDPALLDAPHPDAETRYERSLPHHLRIPLTGDELADARDLPSVAKKSYHMRGMAVDIRVPGRELSYIRKAALDIGTGGVGYYPRSDFIHVDVGPVRQWGMRSA